ncbi:MAG TPA: DUF503 domain-containing protein [Roseiflexaceae bacterium]|nr:DUF503 domain-containing protein [Roseiflexaceae bacterium]
MIIGACTITLHLIGVHSLKEKRSIVKSMVARLRNQFNVSAAEVDGQDSHGRAVIGVACVSGSSDNARGQLEALVRWIEEERPDVPVIDYEIELL